MFNKQITKEYKHGILFGILFFLLYIAATLEEHDIKHPLDDEPQRPRVEYRRQ